MFPLGFFHRYFRWRVLLCRIICIFTSLIFFMWLRHFIFYIWLVFILIWLCSLIFLRPLWLIHEFFGFTILSLLLTLGNLAILSDSCFLGLTSEVLAFLSWSGSLGYILAFFLFEGRINHVLLYLVHTLVVIYVITRLLLDSSDRSLTMLVFLSSKLLLFLRSDRLLGHSCLLHHLMIHWMRILLLLLLLRIVEWFLGYSSALHVDIIMVSIKVWFMPILIKIGSSHLLIMHRLLCMWCFKFLLLLLEGLTSSSSELLTGHLILLGVLRVMHNRSLV